MSTLAARLKRARKEAGFDTATEAAEKCDWNPNTYRSIENGTRGPGFENVIEYADTFNVRLDWLMTGRGPMRRGTTRQVPIFQLSDILGRTKSYGPNSVIIRGDARGYISVPEEQGVTRHTRAFVVVDRSMVDPSGSEHSIYPDDLVGIELGAQAYAGCVVLAEVKGEFVFRKVQIRRTSESGKPTQVALVPLNSDYATEIVPAHAMVGVKLWLQRRDRRPSS